MDYEEFKNEFIDAVKEQLARQGTRVTQEELNEIARLIRPMIKKGQPLTHIYAEHEDELGIPWQREATQRDRLGSGKNIYCREKAVR